MRVRAVCFAAVVSAVALGISSVPAAQTGAPSGDVAKGKARFGQVGCWQCHGSEGQGTREGPRIASPIPLAWPAFSKFVRTTSRNMPPYTETVLANQDLADIYAFLRSIPPAPELTTIPLLSGLKQSPAQR